MKSDIKLPSRFTAGAIFATYSAVIFVVGAVCGFLAGRL